MKLAIVAALLLISNFESVLCNDPCIFTPDGSGTWYGGLAQVKQCFNSIPFSQQRADDTIKLLRKLIDYYPFTDIGENSGAPWNMKVDLDDVLGEIGATTYTSDYEFQSDLGTLFSSLNDAHTTYTLPRPYSNVYVARPFGVQMVNDNGILKFYVTESAFCDTGSSIYDLNFDPSPYFGGELTAIDGTPIVEWFKTFVNKFVGHYKDQSVRFNGAIQFFGDFNLFDASKFSLNKLNNDFTLTINGTDVVAPYYVLFSDGLASTADAIAQIDDAPSPPKRSIVQEEYEPYEPDIHRERKERMKWIKPATVNNRKRFDYSSLNTQAVQKRSEQQASDQVILSVKSGNPANIQITMQATDASIWWGTFTTTDNEIVPYLRIDSFKTNNTEDYSAILTSFSEHVSTNQFDHVIVDVSGNGGGTICLGYLALSIFSEKFRSVSSFGQYDLRRTPSNIDLFTAEAISAVDYRKISTGLVYADNSFFDARNVTRGGLASTLTQKVYFPAECLDFMTLISVDHFPADPIIISDGTCGSTCSLFTSKFVEYGVGRVVTYGGFPGTVMDSSSFPGGNVEKWPEFVKYATNFTLNDPPPMPTTSAEYRFAHHEMYIGTSDVPREFIKLPGQYHAYFYDLIVVDDPTSDVGQQALADLYETAVVAWTITPPPVAAPMASPIDAPQAAAPVSAPVSSPTSVPAKVSLASVSGQSVLFLVAFLGSLIF